MWVAESVGEIKVCDSWDRGAQFGDGLFETILVQDSMPKNIDLHIARLQRGVDVLSINISDINLKAFILSSINDFIKTSKLTHGVYKIIINRGDSARGYAYSSNIKPNIYCFYDTLPVLDSRIYDEGVEVGLCQTPCSIQSSLAGLKHLNRLENVLAKSELKDEFEGVMFNHLGFLIEGTMSNVFLEKDGELYTPSLELSGVEGIMRTRVIQYAKENNITVNIVNIHKQELAAFQAGFMCNSVIGIVPIKVLGSHELEMSVLIHKIKRMTD